MDCMKYTKKINHKCLDIFSMTKKGWDGPESQKIDETTIRAARQLIDEIDQQPELYAMATGTIVLSYITEDGYPLLEVTVLSDRLFFITNRVLNLWEDSIEKAITTTKMMIGLCEE